ncbi:MAG: flagellar hook-associated protein FlgK [Rhizobiales bacterium]|nr:flagellar hook-associated protein FlgK [Hyphomicrobiales bacterium]
MSLTQALSAAISGLKANQSGLALVAANVANADTPGYVRKTVNQVAVAGNNAGISVNVSAIQRVLDTYVQRQLRVENSGAAYADKRAELFQQLQDIYGQPGSANTLETVYNNFTNALQALMTSPDDVAARSSVISAAQLVTQQLNRTSDSIQGLRGSAELGIADAVTKANEAMSQIATLNQRLAASNQNDSATATMMDQRDFYIDQLSQLMDIGIVKTDNNQVSIFTNSGVELVGTKASQISFDAQGAMNATAQWSADPSQRGVGTLTLVSPNGNAVDLIQTNAIRSGQIAAYLQMRDQDLVQAQSQIDAIASAMAAALSDKTATGIAQAVGLQNGFDIDIGGLSAGNTITINYTDGLTRTPRTITLMRVDDASVLPLSDSATASPNDKVFGIDFSGGIGAVLGQINSAIANTGMVASNPSGTTLRVLDDGAGNIVDVDSLSTTATATSLTGGSSELPFFTDGSQPYTGAITGRGAQSVGLAGRIVVNSALAADASKLVVYQAGTAAGDGTRPNFIYQQLTGGALQFSPETGIGTASAPFSGSITTYLRQVISQQGEAADAANNLKQGQDVVLRSLQQRFNADSSVNVDQEMANLLTLQNSYAANARVLSTVKEMLDTLMKM